MFVYGIVSSFVHSICHDHRCVWVVKKWNIFKLIVSRGHSNIEERVDSDRWWNEKQQRNSNRWNARSWLGELFMWQFLYKHLVFFSPSSWFLHNQQFCSLLFSLLPLFFHSYFYSMVMSSCKLTNFWWNTKMILWPFHVSLDLKAR